MRISVIALAIALAAAPAAAGPLPFSNEVDYFVYPPQGAPQICTMSFTVGFEGRLQTGSTTGSLAFGRVGEEAFVGLRARTYAFTQAGARPPQRRLVPISEGAIATEAAPVAGRAVACEPKGAFCGTFAGAKATTIREAVRSGDGTTLLIRTEGAREPLALHIGVSVDARNARAFERFAACMRATAPEGQAGALEKAPARRLTAR